MFGFLLALLVLDGLFLTVIVLLQAGKGGGLAAMGGGAGTDTLIGGRQAATLLTKATWTAGGLFLALALVLAVLSSRATQAESVLEQLRQEAPAATPQPLQLPGTQPQGESPPPSSGSAQPAGPGTQAPSPGAAPATTTTGG